MARDQEWSNHEFGEVLMWVAKLNLRNYRGRTMAIAAAEHEAMEVLMFFILAGYPTVTECVKNRNYRETEDEGFTAAHLVVKRGCEKSWVTLKNADFDFNKATDSKGNDAICMAKRLYPKFHAFIEKHELEECSTAESTAQGKRL